MMKSDLSPSCPVISLCMGVILYASAVWAIPSPTPEEMAEKNVWVEKHLSAPEMTEPPFSFVLGHGSIFGLIRQLDFARRQECLSLRSGRVGSGRRGSIGKPMSRLTLQKPPPSRLGIPSARQAGACDNLVRVGLEQSAGESPPARSRRLRPAWLGYFAARLTFDGNGSANSATA